MKYEPDTTPACPNGTVDRPLKPLLDWDWDWDWDWIGFHLYHTINIRFIPIMSSRKWENYSESY
ncbi:MAG: hypothetical protein A2507_04265 [Candidatus Magasanikbacteria bacterium RIFOXYD12_FULL_33_17]|nr:MAG: hypothetical protein A2507_04265 [Candidatus Magasanikbacteria bacterium RIFOXYD12_FULL_33_17]